MVQVRNVLAVRMKKIIRKVFEFRRKKMLKNLTPWKDSASVFANFKDTAGTMNLLAA